MFSAYRKYAAIAILASASLLLLKPNKKVITPQPNIKLQKINSGYTFSVAVENRYHFIAQKMGTHAYTLRHVNTYAPIKKCQRVYTTGLDNQLKPDILIGYITKIEKDFNDVYLTVEVSRYPNPSIHCQVQE